VQIDYVKYYRKNDKLPLNGCVIVVRSRDHHYIWDLLPKFRLGKAISKHFKFRTV